MLFSGDGGAGGGLTTQQVLDALKKMNPYVDPITGKPLLQGPPRPTLQLDPVANNPYGKLAPTKPLAFTKPGSGEGKYYDKVTPGTAPKKGVKKTHSHSGSTHTHSGTGSAVSGAPPHSPKTLKLPKVNTKQTSDDLARARDLIALEFGPQEQALGRERSQAQRDYEQMLRDLNEQMAMGMAGEQRYGQLADARLQEIYNALQSELQGNVEATRGIYERGQQGVADAYGQSIQGLTAAGTDVQNQLQQQAEALGQGAVTGSPLQDLEVQLQQALAGEQSAQAAGSANLTTLGTQMEAIGQQGVGAAHREEAAERSNIQNEVMGAISQLQIERGQGARKLSESLQNQLLDIGERLSGLAQQKGPALREAVRQVYEARTERERQARLDALAEHIQLATLDIQQGEFGLRQQEFALQKDMMPLERKKLEAEINRINTETGAITKETSGEAGAFSRLEAKINSNPQRYTQAARDAITAIVFRAKDAAEGAAMASSFASQFGVHPQIINELIYAFYGG